MEDIPVEEGGDGLANFPHIQIINYFNKIGLWIKRLNFLLKVELIYLKIIR